MSKAILVVNMPKSCEQCRLHSFAGKDFDIICEAQGRTQSYDVAYKSKPDWCPLREVPKKQSLNGGLSEFQMGARSGYNACIDEILKGSEENE